jgi:hypothetical protein
MNGKSILAKALFLLFLFLLLAPTLFLGIRAQAQPTITTLSLPTDYIPIGIVYKDGFVWTVSYTFGAISKINPSTGEVTNYYIEGAPDTDYTWRFYGLALDASGNFWIAGQKLVVFNPSTGTYTIQSRFEGGTFSPYYGESSSTSLTITVLPAQAPWGIALAVAMVAIAVAVWILVRRRA